MLLGDGEKAAWFMGNCFVRMLQMALRLMVVRCELALSLFGQYMKRNREKPAENPNHQPQGLTLQLSRECSRPSDTKSTQRLMETYRMHLRTSGKQ